jgi:2-iminobutanoate/2-iminopropanoate deaminase
MKAMFVSAVFVPAAVVLAAAPAAKEPVATKDAPPAAGPYSQAIKAGGFVFAAGQIARDPATNKVEGDIKAQTERVLKNLAAVLAAAGTSMERAVKVTVFLKNVGDFQAMNEVYAKFFPAPAPARTTVQAVLPNEAALVEIDIIALQ